MNEYAVFARREPAWAFVAVYTFVGRFVGRDTVSSVESVIGLYASATDHQSCWAFSARSCAIGVDNSNLNTGLVAWSEAIYHTWLDGSQTWRVNGHSDTIVGKYPVFSNVVDDSLNDLCLVGSLKPHLGSSCILYFERYSRTGCWDQRYSEDMEPSFFGVPARIAGCS